MKVGPGMVVLAIAVGACSGEAETGKATNEKTAVSERMTIADACFNPWGEKRLRFLASKRHAGFGIAPLANLSMSDGPVRYRNDKGIDKAIFSPHGQTDEELELLDAACDRAGF